MEFLRKLIERINGNVITRNLVLAFCAIIVFVFILSILLNVFTRHGSHKEVPDFSGMPVEEAIHAARKASLRVEVNDSLYVPAYPGGVVLDQTPGPGTEVKSGRRILVTVNSYRQKMVRIPYVTDFSLRQAKNNLEVAGLGIDKLVYREDLATNYVLEERYKGRLVTSQSNMEAEIGSGVTLVVGMKPGETTTMVPKLVGFPLKEAKSRLWEAGLNVGNIERDGDISALNENGARVYGQSPEQGHRVALGTVVSLRLTLDEKKVAQGSKDSDRAAKSIVAKQAEEEAAGTDAADE